jgi:DNA-directed RNA polymerase II subunit RPB2
MFITHARNGSVPQIHVNVPFLMVSIPLVAIFHVLGVRRTEDMVKLILHDTGDAELNNKLSDMVWSIVGNDNAISAKEKDKTGENSKEKSSNGQNQRQQVKSFGEMSLDDVCDWVGKEGTKEIDRKKRIRSVKHIFQNEFLPHIGLNNEDPVTLLKKTVFLGRMVFKLCMVQMGKWETDDRDHYAFKRVDTTGVLMARLFRPLFRTTLRNMARSIKKCIDSEKLVELKDMLRDRVTNGFRYALSTGRWGVQKGGSSMTGVAQIHSRMTMTSGLGNRRRVNTHINKEGKMPKPRQLHLSHWGIMVCIVCFVFLVDCFVLLADPIYFVVSNSAP